MGSHIIDSIVQLQVVLKYLHFFLSVLKSNFLKFETFGAQAGHCELCASTCSRKTMLQKTQLWTTRYITFSWLEPVVCVRLSYDGFWVIHYATSSPPLKPHSYCLQGALIWPWIHRSHQEC